MNEWLLLVRWALMLIGIVYLITESVILMHFRVGFARTGDYQTVFIYCTACTGFWVGAALGALHFWPLNDTLWALSESAMAGMAVGATWMKLTGGNSAYEAEAELRGDPSYDQQAEEENG